MMKSKAFQKHFLFALKFFKFDSLEELILVPSEVAVLSLEAAVQAAIVSPRYSVSCAPSLLPRSPSVPDLQDGTESKKWTFSIKMRHWECSSQESAMHM